MSENEKYYTKKEIAAAKKLAKKIKWDGTVSSFTAIRFVVTKPVRNKK